MFRTTHIMLLMLLATSARAQEVSCNMAAHHHYHLAERNSQAVLLNGNGDIETVHEVFRLSPEEIGRNGWGTSITADGMAGKRAEDGPTFNLVYLDVVNGTGKGFDDPEKGADRRATLEAAFAYFSAMIGNTGSADVEIRESFSANPGSNPFGYSAAYYFGSSGFNHPFTQVHITSGNDPYDPYPDGYLQFNFHPALPYSYDVIGLPDAQHFDFYTVALHEIMHLLGFSSYASANGQSEAAPNVYTAFDGHLVTFDKKPLFIENSGTSEVVAPDNDLLTNDQVWFELEEGQFAPVFSPTSFSTSSLDHFDNSRTSHQEYVMHPSLSMGKAFKLLHEDEVRALEQLGYEVNYSIATSVSEELHPQAPAKVRSGLYPNPAYNSEPVHISLGELEDPEVLVIVYDMLGRESYSKVIVNRGPGPVTAIDPYSNLAPGMYVVIGSTDDELFNEKLVIRR